MNEQLFERVKRLYEQSAAQCSEGSAWEWEMKFAEAIVHECTNILDDLATLPDDLGGNAYLVSASNKIKKHFGVEK